MNIIDVFILAALLSSIWRGYQIGWLRQIGSTLGFIIGLFLGSLLSNLLMLKMNGSFDKSIANLCIVLGTSLLLMSGGEVIGIQLKRRLTMTPKADKLDGTFGSAMAVITALFGVWLLASFLILAPKGELQQGIENSAIVKSLNKTLPPATKVLGLLNNLVSANESPKVFSGLEPSPEGNMTLPPIASLSSAVNSTKASVVKIEGAGCGGIVEGSGFIVSKDRVATNAHVVAGVSSPKVLDANGLHDSRVVWFDKNLDLAVLEVNGLAGKPLNLDVVNQSSATPAVVEGYPNDGDFTVQPASIIDRFTAVGRNIYGQSETARKVYSIQSKVIPGNSGGPLVSANGQVLGIVFATSTKYNNVGYVLTAQQVQGPLLQAEKSTITYSTSTCSE